MNHASHHLHGSNLALKLLFSLCYRADALTRFTSKSVRRKVSSVNLALSERLKAGSADLLAVTSTLLCCWVCTWCFGMNLSLCLRGNAVKSCVTSYFDLIFQTTKPGGFKSSQLKSLTLESKLQKVPSPAE